jgi:hypothetical protein
MIENRRVTRCPTCAICGGELHADLRSVADMAARGFRGGRITCGVQGCTSIWLFQPIETVIIPVERRGHRETRLIKCEDCHMPTPTRGNNTKRCKACRNKLKLLRARTESERYNELRRQRRQRRRAVA